MKQIDVREGARRQHRVVSLFAVIQCWLRGLDGLAFERRHLERLLGLSKFKGARVEWLQEDFRELFPHIKIYWQTGKKDSLHSMFVARLPMDDSLSSEEMTTTKRIAYIAKEGPRLALFQLWSMPDQTIHESFENLLPFFADKANFDERFLSAYLALLAQGQISPQKMPPVRKS